MNTDGEALSKLLRRDVPMSLLLISRRYFPESLAIAECEYIRSLDLCFVEVRYYSRDKPGLPVTFTSSVKQAELSAELRKNGNLYKGGRKLIIDLLRQIKIRDAIAKKNPGISPVMLHAEMILQRCGITEDDIERIPRKEPK